MKCRGPKLSKSTNLNFSSAANHSNPLDLTFLIYTEIEWRENNLTELLWSLNEIMGGGRGGGSTKHRSWHPASTQMVLVPYFCPQPRSQPIDKMGSSQTWKFQVLKALDPSLPPYPSQTNSWIPSSPSQPQTATKLMKLKGLYHVGIFICKYKSVLV